MYFATLFCIFSNGIRAVVFLLLATFCFSNEFCSLDNEISDGGCNEFSSRKVSNGGWETEFRDIVGADGPCNIVRHDAKSLTQKEFLNRFAFTEPLIITNLDKDKTFQEMCSREQLLRDFSHAKVRLSSANTYSYTKVPVCLQEYIQQYLRPQSVNQLGNETLYLFGDTDAEDWKPLLDRYRKLNWTLPGHRGAPTIGIAGAGTGVPFHFHGPGFAEVIHGRKRWFLYPPDEQPSFDPDNSTLHWYMYTYPNLPREKKPLECLLRPDEVIYFPNLWWHSTLNVETSVFISTFLAP